MKHKHFRKSDKIKKNVDGLKLTKAARRKQKKDKTGVKLLRKYIPKLSKENIKEILIGKKCLVGLNVFFLAEDTKKKRRIK